MGKYYDFGPVLSHNPLVAMVVGGRGIGKSYGAKKLCIDDYLKNGWQFMYARRYKPELAKASRQFFDDIAAAYPEWQFRSNGSEAQIAPRSSGKTSWQTFGYFASLSTVQTLKSVPYPRVKRIVVDEFIPERGAVQYLPSEHEVVMNLLNTVDRHQDKTQMIMLANAVSIMNPHFLAYGIEPKPGKITKYADGLIAVDFPSSSEYNNAVAGTRTARLFAQHYEYNSYATNNEFADNAPTLIARKTAGAKYKWTIEVRNGIFSVWRDDYDNHYYVQAKRPKNELIITMEARSMSDNKMLVTYSDLPLGLMRTAFRHARMSFDSPTTRNAMTEIFRR